MRGSIYEKRDYIKIRQKLWNIILHTSKSVAVDGSVLDAQIEERKFFLNIQDRNRRDSGYRYVYERTRVIKVGEKRLRFRVISVDSEGTKTVDTGV